MTLRFSAHRQLGQFAISASFEAGTGVTALFGKSGSGKTSIVKMIAGLLTPDNGRISLDEQPLFDAGKKIDVAPHRRRIGYVFQEDRLFPHLSVRQNLLYGAWFVRAPNRHAALGSIVELLGIGALLKRTPISLSGGERQRVAIGRALLADPKLLLMDEPMASLDAARKGEILPYLERLRDELKIPIVYVSHALEEVTRLANTLVLLSEGEVAAYGPASELMSRLELRPLTGRYEAGAMIEAEVSAYLTDFDLTELRFPGGILKVPGIDLPVGSRVRVRIRARDVSLALTPPADISILNCLRATVLDISQEEGAFAEINLAIEETRLLARITRKSVTDLKLEIGNHVYALIKSIALDRRSLGLSGASRQAHEAE